MRCPGDSCLATKDSRRKRRRKKNEKSRKEKRADGGEADSRMTGTKRALSRDLRNRWRRRLVGWQNPRERIENEA